MPEILATVSHRFQRFDHARRCDCEGDLETNDAAMRTRRTAVIRYDGLRSNAVWYNNHVMRPSPQPRSAPINLHDLTGNLIGQGNPISGSEWTFDIDREACEHVTQCILKRQAKDNRQNARRRHEG